MTSDLTSEAISDVTSILYGDPTATDEEAPTAARSRDRLLGCPATQLGARHPGESNDTSGGGLMPRTGPLLCRTCWWLGFAAVAFAAAARAAAPRPIELLVDATDARRGFFHSRLDIPAAPGSLALAYPKWIQGEHTPSGPITQLAGLTITALGRTLPRSEERRVGKSVDLGGRRII